MTPLTKKRLKAFRRIKRAWWSLISLVAIFVFCLCADWVCPCDPREVVDPATLEAYREASVERTYDVRAARFSVGADKRPEWVRRILVGEVARGREAEDWRHDVVGWDDNEAAAVEGDEVEEVRAVD